MVVYSHIIGNKALVKINELTSDDFIIERRETKHILATSDLINGINTIKDENGEILYKLNNITFGYCSKHFNSSLLEKEYENKGHIKETAYKEFISYTDGIDEIVVKAKEIHFRLRDESKYKYFAVAVREINDFIGKMNIPFILEHNEISDEEIELYINELKKWMWSFEKSIMITFKSKSCNKEESTDGN